MSNPIIKTTATQMRVDVLPLEQGVGLQVELHATYDYPVQRFTVFLTPAEACALAAQLTSVAGGP
jgi:hypothetical protein